MPRLRKHWLPVYCFYLFCAALITWPLVIRMDTHLAGFQFRDSAERAHHIWWLVHALRTGQPLFWLPNLGWPDGMAGITLVGHPLQHMPAALLALFLPLLIADNLALLLQIALMGLAMYALGLHLARGCRRAALVGGLVFMAAPTFQAHLGDGHNIHHSLAFAPLFVLAILRMRSVTGRSRRRWFVAGALSFALVSGGHALNAIHMMIPLVVVLFLQGLLRRDWRGLGQLVLVCLAGASLQFLVLLPVIGETLRHQAYTDSDGDVVFSLDLLSIVTPSRFHPIYGHLEHALAVLGSRPAERSSWIGFIPGALALLALARGRGRLWLGLALISWVLALGPLLKLLGEPLIIHVDERSSYLTMPQILFEYLPVLNIERTPGRFSFALALAVACLATTGMATLAAKRRMQGRRWRLVTTTALLALVLFDYQWYWPLPTFDATVPAEIAALGQRPGLRAVLNIPNQSRDVRNAAMWLHTAHGLPILGGQVTRKSPVNPARLELLQQTMDPALLRAAGADLVILHLRYATREQFELAGARLGPPIYLDDNHAVYETPDTDIEAVRFVPPATTQRFSGSVRVPVYSPRTGWLDVSADQVEGRRDLLLLLDSVPLQRWSSFKGNPRTRIVSLPLQARGWHMLTIRAVPVCSVVPDPVPQCPVVELNNLRLAVVSAPFVQARFVEGVELRAASLPAQAQAGEELTARMHWVMEEGRDRFDVRFVHVLDETGRLVAQSDEDPGFLPAGSEYVERVELQLPEDLPAGEYSVWLGWYRYPEIRRLPLIEPGGLAGDILPLGVVRVE
ncbi:MAG: hypothetical protein OXF63_10265 [Anaerolineaceae bacterium]|nr:hypothetical protein [Anaerolineaceae bacterium]